MKWKDLRNLKIRKKDISSTPIQTTDEDVTLEIQDLIITGRPQKIIEFLTEMNKIGGNM